MPLQYYFDHHVPRAIAEGVRQRGVDVLTAAEDGTHTWQDVDLLERAAALGRVLFTYDQDFLMEAAHRQQHNIPFAGIIWASGRHSVGRYIRELELIAKVSSPADLAGRVEHIPL